MMKSESFQKRQWRVGDELISSTFVSPQNLSLSLMSVSFHVSRGQEPVSAISSHALLCVSQFQLALTLQGRLPGKKREHVSMETAVLPNTASVEPFYSSRWGWLLADQQLIVAREKPVAFASASEEVRWVSLKLEGLPPQSWFPLLQTYVFS